MKKFDQIFKRIMTESETETVRGIENVRPYIYIYIYVGGGGGGLNIYVFK